MRAQSIQQAAFPNRSVPFSFCGRYAEQFRLAFRKDEAVAGVAIHARMAHHKEEVLLFTNSRRSSWDSVSAVRAGQIAVLRLAERTTRIPTTRHVEKAQAIASLLRQHVPRSCTLKQSLPSQVRQIGSRRVCGVTSSQRQVPTAHSRALTDKPQGLMLVCFHRWARMTDEAPAA